MWEADPSDSKEYADYKALRRQQLEDSLRTSFKEKTAIAAAVVLSIGLMWKAATAEPAHARLLEQPEAAAVVCDAPTPKLTGPAFKSCGGF